MTNWWNWGVSGIYLVSPLGWRVNALLIEAAMAFLFLGLNFVVLAVVRMHDKNVPWTPLWLRNTSV